MFTRRIKSRYLQPNTGKHVVKIKRRKTLSFFLLLRCSFWRTSFVSNVWQGLHGGLCRTSSAHGRIWQWGSIRLSRNLSSTTIFLKFKLTDEPQCAGLFPRSEVGLLENVVFGKNSIGSVLAWITSNPRSNNDSEPLQKLQRRHVFWLKSYLSSIC